MESGDPLDHGDIDLRPRELVSVGETDEGLDDLMVAAWDSDSGEGLVELVGDPNVAVLYLDICHGPLPLADCGSWAMRATATSSPDNGSFYYVAGFWDPA